MLYPLLSQTSVYRLCCTHYFPKLPSTDCAVHITFPNFCLQIVLYSLLSQTSVYRLCCTHYFPKLLSTDCAVLITFPNFCLQNPYPQITRSSGLTFTKILQYKKALNQLSAFFGRTLFPLILDKLLAAAHFLHLITEWVFAIKVLMIIFGRVKWFGIFNLRHDRVRETTALC